MVYHAFYSFSTITQPLSLEQAVTYTWLTQVTFRMLPWNSDTEITAMIRSGNVAYELCRPLNLYFIWYSRLLSFRLVPTLLTGIPLYVIAGFLPGGSGITPPGSIAAGTAWAVSTLFALLLGCAISNLVTVSTLWTIAGDGMQRILPGVILILSGAVVPLAYFPDWTQIVLKLLPFSGLIDIPFRFYLGMIPASEIFSIGLIQMGWTVIFILIGVRLLNTGMKKVVVQGG